jgi:hypothetical protein
LHRIPCASFRGRRRESRGLEGERSEIEQSLIPELDGEISRIEVALEEREREDLTRLKRFKAKREGGPT